MAFVCAGASGEMGPDDGWHGGAVPAEDPLRFRAAVSAGCDPWGRQAAEPRSDSGRERAVGAETSFCAILYLKPP